MNKKQAVLIRIPGLHAYSQTFQQKLAEQLRITLQANFDKEIVVLLYPQDIQFLKESDIRDLIDSLENVIA